MTNSMQHCSWLSGATLPAARGTLALTAVLVLAVVLTQMAQAQTFSVLQSFDSTNGANPTAALVQATNGDLYGTANGGGTNCEPVGGCGAVFKITPGGTLTTLYSFCAQSGCPDGANPYGALVQATNGNFYGTTLEGGANGNFGTIFKITPSGALTPLYSFCSQPRCVDGANTYAGLVLATNGDFYGTTSGGGANGQGTVFKITPSGTLTTLYSFCSLSNCADGGEPEAGLIQATNGNFYGTTAVGGANGGDGENYGTVFEITPKGKLTTLYSFCSLSDCADGFFPIAGLVQATDGNFYGTTGAGGANQGGSVFKITPSGTLHTLYSFCSLNNCTDGANPEAELIQATDGNFYGTTSSGGANGSYGTIFQITSGGILTPLYSFCSQSDCTDGWSPVAGLLQNTNGSLYGLTVYGGADEDGIIFSLSVGLGPFVETLPTSGKVGKAVKILGTDLTGATSVAFNGTAATFKVVSSTEITTRVPTGATTGTVELTTPSGTLNSNVVFRVAP
jgi:uncharacterized repeat protein (TIGR03803 family)